MESIAEKLFSVNKIVLTYILRYDNPGNDKSNSNNPANGTGSGTGNTSNDAGRIKDDVPKTGDSMPVAVPITGAVCVASLAVMGMLFTKRRKM